MDVEITIHYSDERPCKVVLTRPYSGDILYMVVTPKGYGKRAGFSR
jgi:hypothetical protein